MGVPAGTVPRARQTVQERHDEAQAGKAGSGSRSAPGEAGSGRDRKPREPSGGACRQRLTACRRPGGDRSAHSEAPPRSGTERGRARKNTQPAVRTGRHVTKRPSSGFDPRDYRETAQQFC
jgi:hypothetical protein